MSKILSAILLGAFASAATAQTAPPTPAGRATAVAAPIADQSVRDTWTGAAAPPDRLERLRGGADTVTTQASLNATVADNSARNVVTGNNVIDSGSFANMSGMSMVIQNTGANVLIQNATVINLQLR